MCMEKSCINNFQQNKQNTCGVQAIEGRLYLYVYDYNNHICILIVYNASPYLCVFSARGMRSGFNEAIFYLFLRMCRACAGQHFMVRLSYNGSPGYNYFNYQLYYMYMLVKRQYIFGLLAHRFFFCGFKILFIIYTFWYVYIYVVFKEKIVFLYENARCRTHTH